jgi:hypothetical protein
VDRDKDRTHCLSCGDIPWKYGFVLLHATVDSHVLIEKLDVDREEERRFTVISDAGLGAVEEHRTKYKLRIHVLDTKQMGTKHSKKPTRFKELSALPTRQHQALRRSCVSSEASEGALGAQLGMGHQEAWGLSPARLDLSMLLRGPGALSETYPRYLSSHPRLNARVLVSPARSSQGGAQALIR